MIWTAAVITIGVCVLFCRWTEHRVEMARVKAKRYAPAYMYCCEHGKQHAKPTKETEPT